MWNEGQGAQSKGLDQEPPWIRWWWRVLSKSIRSVGVETSGWFDPRRWQMNEQNWWSKGHFYIKIRHELRSHTTWKEICTWNCMKSSLIGIRRYKLVKQAIEGDCSIRKHGISHLKRHFFSIFSVDVMTHDVSNHISKDLLYWICFRLMSMWFGGSSLTLHRTWVDFSSWDPLNLIK